MIPPEHAEVVPDFSAFGVTAFTTTRVFGTLTNAQWSEEAARRWETLRDLVREEAGITRLATSIQVHGNHVIAHTPDWDDWHRAGEGDGHFADDGATALAVTVADCVPVFIAHPGGSLALLHSGWRGTVARIIEAGIREFTARRHAAADLRVHLGPAICGACYEVSADVAQQLLGAPQSSKRTVDLRAIIADHARALGVRHITISRSCTRHDNDRFFSHRAGDAGRQVGFMFASP